MFSQRFSEDKIHLLLSELTKLLDSQEMSKPAYVEFSNILKISTWRDLVDLTTESEEIKHKMKVVEIPLEKSAQIITTQIAIPIREDVFMANLQRAMEVMVQSARKQKGIPADRIEQAERLIAGLQKKDLRPDDYDPNLISDSTPEVTVPDIAIEPDNEAHLGSQSNPELTAPIKQEPITPPPPPPPVPPFSSTINKPNSQASLNPTDNYQEPEELKQDVNELLERFFVDNTPEGKRDSSEKVTNPPEPVATQDQTPQQPEPQDHHDESATTSLPSFADPNRSNPVVSLVQPKNFSNQGSSEDQKSITT